MYDEPVRTEAQTFVDSQHVKAASQGVTQQSKLRAIVTLKHAPGLYAAGEPNTPADKIVRIPGMEHNLEQIIKSVYHLLEWSMNTECRQHSARLADLLSLRILCGSWNQATYRQVIANYAQLFDGLVTAQLYVIAQTLAPVLPVLYRTDQRAVQRDYTHRACTFFGARVLVEYGYRGMPDVGEFHTASLRWQSVGHFVELAHNQLADAPLGHLLEGPFESFWKVLNCFPDTQ